MCNPNVLKDFQFGLEKTLPEKLASLRAKSLEISPYREMATWQASSTHSLDIERSGFRYLLSGSNDGSVVIFDLDTFGQSPRQVCRIVASVNRYSSRAHKSICSWVQWHPADTGVFTSSSRDKTLKIWDTNDMKPVEQYTFDNPVVQHSLAPAHSKSCMVAVATSSSNVYLIDLVTGAKLQQLRAHKDSVICCQWSPTDPNILLSAGQDGQIFVWDVRSAKGCLTSLIPNEESNGNSAFPIRKAHRHPINGLKFTSDGLQLLSLDTEGNVKLWDGRTLKQATNFGPRKLNGNLVVRAVGLDFACHSSGPTGRLAYIPDEANIAVLSLVDGRRYSNLIGHYAVANCCTYREPYQELYSAGFDHMVLVWLSQMERHHDFMQHESGDKVDFEKMMADNWEDDE